MFSFLGPLLIVLSLAGIIVIVLRRTPELRGGTTLAAGKAIWSGGKWAAGKAWQFLLEVKQVSKGVRKAASHLPRPNFRMFAGKLTADLDTENFADTERRLIKAIEKNPKDEEAYASLGRLYLAQKKYEEAIATYKFLVKYFPQNDGYFASLGQAYHGQKLYERAVEAYEKAIELDPANVRRYINLGLTLEAQRHLEEAILNYRRAAEMEKDNPQFLLMLAGALIKKGEKEEAGTVLERILVLEPTNHLAREKLMALKF